MRQGPRVRLLGRSLLPLVCLGWLGAQSPNPDARSIGLAGAVTSLAQGVHAVGYNPANLAFSTKDFSMNLGGFTYTLENNMLSIRSYNEFSGADFIDTLSADYQDKAEFLAGLPDNGMNIRTMFHLPVPALNWARGITAFTSEIALFGNLGLPKALFNLMMEGNIIGDSLLLDLNEEFQGAAEWGFSVAIPTGGAAFGFTLKYLQGLFHLGVDQDSSGGYFMTDTSGFKGEGRYLIRQAIGGGGFGLDLGFATEEINGYRFGISLINALGSIRWHGTSLTKDLLGGTIQGLMPWRENEYFLYTYRVNEVTARKYMQGGAVDTLFQNDSYTVVETESGLVPSDTLTNADLEAITPKPFVTDYPTLFRVGASKRIENFGLVAVDLLTGFRDQLWASQGWQLAVGIEILASPSFPLRMGLRYGGMEDTQLGIGFGIHKGPIQFDMALALHNGIWLHTTKGFSLALGLTLVR